MVYYIILILDLLWPRLSRSFELPWGWTSTGFQVISSQDPWISFFPILTHGTAPWHCRCRMWTELCSTPCGCDLNWDCLIPRLTNPTGNWAQVQGWFRERCLSRHLRLFVPLLLPQDVCWLPPFCRVLGMAKKGRMKTGQSCRRTWFVASFFLMYPLVN